MANGDHGYIIRCPSCATANRVPQSSEGKRGKCGSCHAALPPLFTHPVELTDSDFDSFLRQTPGLVLAEFWAPW